MVADYIGMAVPALLQGRRHSHPNLARSNPPCLPPLHLPLVRHHQPHHKTLTPSSPGFTARLISLVPTPAPGLHLFASLAATLYQPPVCSELQQTLPGAWAAAGKALWGHPGVLPGPPSVLNILPLNQLLHYWMCREGESKRGGADHTAAPLSPNRRPFLPRPPCEGAPVRRSAS